MATGPWAYYVDYAASEHQSMRLATKLNLEYGKPRGEYEWDIDLTWGLRLGSGPGHAAVARIGTNGPIWGAGSARLRWYLVQLPTVHIGYQFADSKRVLELVAKTGYAW